MMTSNYAKMVWLSVHVHQVYSDIWASNNGNTVQACEVPKQPDKDLV